MERVYEDPGCSAFVYACVEILQLQMKAPNNLAIHSEWILVCTLWNRRIRDPGLLGNLYICETYI